MAYIAINCPNCSAPLQVIVGSQSATCSYCRSTFVPRSQPPANDRTTAATERTAAELALVRLQQERINTYAAIDHEKYLAKEPLRKAEREDEKDRRAYERNEERQEIKRKEWRDARDKLFELGIALFILGVFSWLIWDWQWMLQFGGLLLLAAVLSAGVLEWMAKKAPPKRRSVPAPLPPSDNAIRLRQHLQHIDAEIARHRRFLEESKPAYAANDEPTQQK